MVSDKDLREGGIWEIEIWTLSLVVVIGSACLRCLDISITSAYL